MKSRAFALIHLLSLALLGPILGSTQPVRADVAVMVPPHIDQLASNDLLEQATEELTRLLKLQGFDVISAGQAGPAAEAEQAREVFPRAYDPLYCLSPECAHEYRKLFDATFAVQLLISSRAARPSSVSVVLTENPKAYFGGSAPIEGRDIRTAVRSAFETARQKQEEGAGPWLSVNGSPKGALVYLDGVEYGAMPFSKRHVEGGAHKLEVRAEGYHVQVRTLSISGTIDHVEQVTVALVPLDEDQARADAASERHRRVHRSPWDWLLGGTIASVGAVHLASGIYQKVKAGDCSAHAEGVCSQHYVAHPMRENLLIGLGAAGVAAGAVVVGLGPIGHLQLRAGADHAVLQLKGKF